MTDDPRPAPRRAAHAMAEDAVPAPRRATDPLNDEPVPIRTTVNGRVRAETVEPRLLLSDFLRHRLGLTGTHVGCEHGVCGACTVLVDGRATRSCLLFAVQADGREITTVEGLAPLDAPLSALQEAFREHHALQCGFCTPGILMAAGDLLAHEPDAGPERIAAVLGGHICRCTGYEPIVAAIRAALERP